jgi:hypothetical protein
MAPSFITKATRAVAVMTTKKKIGRQGDFVYVAMTRAKDRLTLTHCKQRHGKPTRGVRLVDELRSASI